MMENLPSDIVEKAPCDSAYETASISLADDADDDNSIASGPKAVVKERVVPSCEKNPNELA